MNVTARMFDDHHPDGAGGPSVDISVRDHGIGIPADRLEGIFEDFAQGSDHGDEIRGGFGLGLASARRVAGLMDGTVGLERKWRAGSAFWLELPAGDGKAT